MNVCNYSFRGRVNARNYFFYKGSLRPSLIQERNSAVAVKIASPEEFSAVSIESWMTEMINPIPTICMAIFLKYSISKILSK